MTTDGTKKPAPPNAAVSLSDVPDPLCDVQMGERRFLRPLLVVFGAILLAFSQPMIIEPLGSRAVDPTGLSGVLALVGWAPFLLAVRGTTVKQTFWWSVLFLQIKYSIVLYWLVIAMHVFGHIPIIISIFLLELLCFTIATGLGAMIAAAQLVHRHFGIPFWFLFLITFGGGEYIRNIGPLGGFPWGHDGTAFATVPVLLQTASLVGAYGLLLITLFVNVAVAELGAFLMGVRKRAPFAICTVAVATIISMLAYGTLRLSDQTTAPQTVRVGLLQGNIDQGIKNSDRLNRRTIINRYRELQERAIKDGSELVVWPEAALPGGVPAAADASLLKSRIVGRDGEVPTAGVFGAAAYARQGGQRQVFNSAFVTGKDFEIVGRLDKLHLVPFGEYVPWPFGPIVDQVVPGGQTTAGTDSPVLEVKLPGKSGVDSVRLATTICYEGLFPEIGRDVAQKGAQLVVNITNDAWYGVSSAALQHFAAYAIRAAETARPIARAANTGISGWFDNRGRVRHMSDLYVADAVVADVEIATGDEVTPYMMIGEKPIIVAWCLALTLWFFTLCGPGALRRKRSTALWLVAALGGIAMLGAHALHWVISPPGANEALSTQNQFLFIAGLLICAGALSGRRWGRRAILIASQVCASLLVMELLTGGFRVGPVVVLVLSQLIFFVAFRRPNEFQRAPETFLANRRRNERPDGAQGG